MCRRTHYVFACNHAEEVVSKCRSPNSVIIPRRCLPGFKLAETETSDARCMACSIKQTNAACERKEKRGRVKLQGTEGAGRVGRANAEVVGGTEMEDSLNAEAPKVPDEHKGEVVSVVNMMSGIPLAELD